jgi:hypothetical protein
MEDIPMDTLWWTRSSSSKFSPRILSMFSESKIMRTKFHHLPSNRNISNEQMIPYPTRSIGIIYNDDKTFGSKRNFFDRQLRKISDSFTGIGLWQVAIILPIS